MPTSIRKAVIPAAGFGTRFLPVTKAVPKELLPIIDRPTIQLIFEELKSAGVTQFIVVISKGKESLKQYFTAAPDLEKHLEGKKSTALLALVREASSYGDVQLVYQDHPRGLGHAVLCAREAVGDEPFLVALGDDLIDADPCCARQMVERFARHQKPMVAVQKVPASEVSKYGIVDPKSGPIEKGLLPLKDLVEKPSPEKAPSDLAIVGRYLLTPDIFPILAQTGQGAGGEIQLTDALKTLNQRRELLAYEFDGVRLDAGDKFGFLQANLHYGLKHPDTAAKLRAYLRHLKLEE